MGKQREDSQGEDKYFSPNLVSFVHFVQETIFMYYGPLGNVLNIENRMETCVWMPVYTKDAQTLVCFVFNWYKLKWLTNSES